MLRWLLGIVQAALPLSGLVLASLSLISWSRQPHADLGRAVGSQVVADLAILLVSLLYLLDNTEEWLRRRLQDTATPGVLFKRFLFLIYPILALVLFVALVSLVADAYGLLLGDLFTDVPSLLGKLVLLMLSLLALRAGAKYGSFPPIELLNGVSLRHRGQLGDLQCFLARGISPVHPILVTSFEQTYQHYVTESATSERWMEAWKRQVSRTSTPVSHIVRIYSERNLTGDLYDRINVYRDVASYEIRVLMIPPVLPVVDLYLEEGRYAIVGFPNDALRPFLTEEFLCLTERRSVALLANWFRSMWNQGIIVKDSTGREDGLDLVRETMEQVGACDSRLLEAPHRLVMAGARAAPEALRLLVELTKLQDLDVLTSRAGRELRHRLDILADDLRKLPLTPYTEFGGIGEALIASFVTATKSVVCTAVINEDERFWQEDDLTTQRLAEIIQERHLLVQRIFVFRNRESVDQYLPLMKTQAAAGVEVWYVVHSGRWRDFAIIDSDAVLLDNAYAAILSTAADDVERSRAEFNALRAVATRVSHGEGTGPESVAGESVLGRGVAGSDRRVEVAADDSEL